MVTFCIKQGKLENFFNIVPLLLSPNISFCRYIRDFEEILKDLVIVLSKILLKLLIMGEKSCSKM